MKKYLLVVLILAMPLSGFAYEEWFVDMEGDECPDMVVVNNGNTALCGSEDSAFYLRLKSGKRLAQLPAKVKHASAQDLMIVPDADYNQIYRYNRELLDQKGKRLGYLVIEAYKTSEMDVTIQVSMRYDLDGTLRTISAK